jgi:hypothetical protein
MARHYARGADLKPKMRGVVAAFEQAVNERRTKTVKPACEIVKPLVDPNLRRTKR